MENVIIAVVLLAIIGGAAGYVIKAKKSGKKCIGCPDSGCCGKDGRTGCGCGCAGCTSACHTEENDHL